VSLTVVRIGPLSGAGRELPTGVTTVSSMVPIRSIAYGQEYACVAAIALLSYGPTVYKSAGLGSLSISSKISIGPRFFRSSAKAISYSAQARVPSRFLLELTGASSGEMRLSDHAARSMI
jgi:hypothetical protein